MRQTRPITLCAFILATLAATAVAAPTLVVTETPGDYYTITAQDSVDPAVTFWEIRVDVASGGIYSLQDLTDAGDGAGGHTDYLGASAYNRQCTLLYFDGRGGNVGSRRAALTAGWTLPTFESPVSARRRTSIWRGRTCLK